MIVQIAVDHRAQLGPVRDQGARETCLSHATSLAHEKAREKPVPLSPEYLHFFASGGRAGGCSLNEVAGALELHGQPVEDDCPYLESNPAPGWRPALAAEVFRRFSDDTRLDVAEVERLIRAGNVPVLGISLPDEFFRPSAPWIIPAGNRVMGLHAVAGVGIGDHGAAKAILIRNSWGVDWGDDGHAWLDSDFIARHLKGVLVLTKEVT